MDINTLIGAGIVTSIGGSVLYGCKDFIKTLFTKMYSKFIYTVKVYQYDELFFIIEEWLANHYPEQHRLVEASVGDVLETNEILKEDVKLIPKKEIKYKQEEDVIKITYENKFIWIDKNREKIDKATNTKDIYFSKFSIYGWKAKKEINKLLEEMLKEYELKRQDNTVGIYVSDKDGYWDLSKKSEVKTIDKIVLNEGVNNTILSDLNEFLNSKEFYKNLGIPYKRGYCFYGEPGNGKTSLALAIASYLKRDVFILNLSSLDSDGALQRAFSRFKNNGILLIEDIDKVFSKRDTIKENISFSCFINCLDGAFYKDGIITIMTTNHIETLDPALIRDGRVDLKIEIKKPEKEEVYKYLELFYNKPIQRNGLQTNLSMSSIQEKCIKNKNDYKKAIIEIHNI